MRPYQIALKNLMRRPARMFFLTVALAVGLAAVVALVTLSNSMTADIEHTMDQFGANILITPKSNDLALSYGGISLGRVSFDQRELDPSVLQRIRTIKNRQNIAAVAPKVLGTVTLQGRELLLVGVDFAAELRMKPWWRLTGTEPSAPDHALLGSSTALVLGLKPGDRLTITGRSFTVAALLQETGSQDDGLLFVPLAAAQAITAKQGKITLIEVAALCSGCPIGEMVEQIAGVLPDAKVSAIKQVVEGRLQTIAQLKRFSLGMGGVIALIGLLVVFITMMGSVNERKVEIGIFRAIGYRTGHVMGIILLEAGLVGLVAGLTGYLLGVGAAAVALPLLAQSGHPHLLLQWQVALAAIGAVGLVSLLAAVYPARRAGRMDPADALRSL
ncbi:ABC transporter permease [Trichlorobacter lovleyi]|uniref:ABC transporter permease n=1 Tax=Trichlorobacter lovleyi TaxID=313985 RepID=UPI002240DBE4|nr:FtsX-like permease family protein [Trichlorobacter lovleyi]QOX77768.1 ABC transporter permease [Trichlorobacter lovleyi]